MMIHQKEMGQLYKKINIVNFTENEKRFSNCQNKNEDRKIIFLIYGK